MRSACFLSHIDIDIVINNCSDLYMKPAILKSVRAWSGSADGLAKKSKSRMGMELAVWDLGLGFLCLGLGFFGFRI